jgi:ABC-type Mn2+/Zn2+ transport system permease subunit
VRYIVEPFTYEFFPRALVASILVMLLGALAGPGVQARRQVYLGQGVSQSMLLGVAAAALVGLPGILAAALAAALASGAVVALQKRVETDVAIATIGGAFLSLGVIVLSVRRDRAVNVSNLLFGNVLGVTWGDVMVLAGVVVVAGGVFLVSARSLALLGISREVAMAHGVRVARFELTQTLAVALTVAAFVQVAGTLLAISAIVLPAAIGHQRARTLAGVHAVAALAGSCAAVLGLYASYWSDIPSGPAITVIATVVLVAAAFLPSRSS